MADMCIERTDKCNKVVRFTKVILPPDWQEAYPIAKRLVADNMPDWGDMGMMAFRTTHPVEATPGGFRIITDVKSDPYRSAVFVGVSKAPDNAKQPWVPVWVAQAAEA